ncbi:GntR family transcriptional regulator [Aerococcaceae bacterium zg-BR22]|uniref:GntR family transcriptional regulator n=1 Tax=Aerococcaceae bacterium zg-1292 TaxID=2774330 RepID=UPI004062A607|nr:GntR family transcriptional regulator [Aerococcaceae bacterium zg-BR22]
MEKYIYIANDMRNRILKGEFSSNDKLPFEKELIKEYSSSKMTVKKALDMLVAEGLIIKRRGSGTFVKSLSENELKKRVMSNQFRGTTALNVGKKVESIILNFSVIEADKLISEKLHIESGSFVYDIYRARKIDGEPLVIEQMYMPIDLIVGLKKNNALGSIYEYIEESLKLKIKSAHRTITVRGANEIEARYLEVEEKSPVAVAEQIAFLDTGEAFEYSKSVHRADKYSIEVILNKD